MMYPRSESGLAAQMYRSVTAELRYESPLFSSSPIAAQPSSSRSVASAGAPIFAAISAAVPGIASNAPSDTAANIVCDRRNASIKSITGSAEMVISSPWKYLAVQPHHAGIPSPHRAYVCERNAVELKRHTTPRPHRKQQFVIL